MYTMMVRDISSRKQIEQIKNELISTVSHELRTPLTAISGAILLLEGGVAGNDESKNQKLIQLASRNSDRLMNLVNDLLDFEKLQSGTLEFTFDTTDLVALVHQSIELNQPMADKYSVSLDIVESIDGILIRMDRDRIMQVMSNLLSNAAKFSKEGGDVEVSIQHNQSMVRVSVSDSGVGIPEDYRNRVFERFTRYNRKLWIEGMKVAAYPFV